MRYYFTYGSSGQPFRGGWTVVVAQNKALAVEIFRRHHPDKTPGIVNCAGIYREERFALTLMAQNGNNLGHGCWEILKK